MEAGSIAQCVSILHNDGIVEGQGVRGINGWMISLRSYSQVIGT